MKKICCGIGLWSVLWASQSPEEKQNEEHPSDKNGSGCAMCKPEDSNE